MDTPNPIVKRIHETLFDDLGKLGQLVEPTNDKALSVLYEAMNHLRDLEPMIDPQPNIQFRKAQIEGGYTEIDVIDVLIDRLEGAEAVCDIMAVVAESEHTEMGSDLADTTLHRAAFTARNLVTECLEKTKVWSAQHSSREAS